MPGGGGGLGTSTQTANTSQNTGSASLTGPWQPAAAAIQNLLLPGIINNNAAYRPTSTENQAFQNAIGALSIPNAAPAQMYGISGALNSSQGDPFGVLRQQLGNVNQYQKYINPAEQLATQAGNLTQQNYNQLSPWATANPDPMHTPGIQNLLSTIQADVSNSINGQFAGAGRSLSGLNQQDLARGLAQGEAVPLLNQYNQNVGNILQAQGMQGGLANQLSGIGQTQAGIAGVGGGLSQLAAGLGQQQLQNWQQAPQMAQMAPYLASMPYMQQQQIMQQMRLSPVEGLGAFANLYTPLAALGGQASGLQNSLGSLQGSSTASPLSQISQGVGILGGLGGFI